MHLPSIDGWMGERTATHRVSPVLSLVEQITDAGAIYAILLCPSFVISICPACGVLSVCTLTGWLAS